MVGLLVKKKHWGYLQRFKHHTGVWQTDGRTDILPRHIRAMHMRRAVMS